jgi:hypothetical protein
MSRKNKKIVEKRRQREKKTLKKRGSRERKKKKERAQRKPYPSLNLCSPPLSSQKG